MQESPEIVRAKKAVARKRPIGFFSVSRPDKLYALKTKVHFGAVRGRQPSALGHVGFPDMLSRYHHPGTSHISTRHADQVRPETEADRGQQKPTEADGSVKME